MDIDSITKIVYEMQLYFKYKRVYWKFRTTEYLGVGIMTRKGNRTARKDGKLWQKKNNTSNWKSLREYYRNKSYMEFLIVLELQEAFHNKVVTEKY